ncbi:chemotaxis protein CheW [Jannaschia seohaensis]|uniref:Purine-binding chemotaxis protein CheW n=1 Tax=Jannaschia seohaensis TaxID=475081 RepID=A0A2Y9B8F1_9RHOB|nr:chemotaxis protein CheW [Jannaschia seohaensis]PWJ10185.1 purine-binding chemotaxis protein CheW [Jannaschia seohaensis]SSA51758.1 purine-binding chemotaxis protein CheW [Jannaschia seohaensis]
MILTFRIRGERFALTVQHVNEIIDPIPETPVPRASAWAPSLVNVRGSVVPMFDIRHRLGLGRAEPSETSRIVVLDVEIQGEPTRLAVLVEAVEDVIEAELASFETIPDLGARWPERFIQGVAHHGSDLVVLLNSDTLFHVEINRSTAA